MEEITCTKKKRVRKVKAENDLAFPQELLIDTQRDFGGAKVMSVPIAELSTLGSGVSSLIPAMNTVTQTTTIATDGLYRLANASVGDTLKIAKDGNAWGAFKTAAGKSKMAKLQEAGPVSATTTSVVAFNPATAMMAVALFSIEQDLGKIEDMQRQILLFLEDEKESEIEADVETLMSLVRKYKSNWDNEHYIASSHKLAVDIQRTARKNVNVYKREITDVLDKKQLVIAQRDVKRAYKELERLFKYYRLSLYTFSLASFIEIMLSGNFKEEYINEVKKDVNSLTIAYRRAFGKASRYLEKLGESELEANVLNGVGAAEKAVGTVIGAIPLIRRGPVDELLKDSGSEIKQSAVKMKKNAVHQFASLGNPETGVLINKMDDMVNIYNHTEEICFDNKRIYLISDKTKIMKCE